jgi:hypothetical protein
MSIEALAGVLRELRRVEWSHSRLRGALSDGMLSRSSPRPPEAIVALAWPALTRRVPDLSAVHRAFV